MQSIDGRTNQTDDGFEWAVGLEREHELILELRPEWARVTVNWGQGRTYPSAGRSLTVVSPWRWNPGADGPGLALGSYESPTRFLRMQIADRTAGEARW